jgi:hypothetical protein
MSTTRPFIGQAEMINYMIESGRKAVLRRSQVHPTVVYSGLRSVVATSAVGISAQDVMVQMSGGTPEGIVAGVMLGFQRLIYVTTQAKEHVWMSLPSKAVELSASVDYGNYASPDPDEPEKGFLAVEALRGE